MKRSTAKVRPFKRRTLRALGGRRIMVQNFGKKSPTFIAITAGGDQPSIHAWISPSELRRFVDAARRILR